MNKYLTKISEEEYLEKLNDRFIDSTITETDKDIFIINKFFNREKRLTAVELKYPTDIAAENSFTYNDSHMVYDHIDNFRLPVPKGEPIKSIRCAFSSHFIDFKQIKYIIKEPWINQDYKIYLVNPRLYHYFVKGTIPLAHVRDLDSRYFEGMTDHCVNSINKLMIDETGEPLFYLI